MAARLDAHFTGVRLARSERKASIKVLAMTSSSAFVNGTSVSRPRR